MKFLEIQAIVGGSAEHSSFLPYASKTLGGLAHHKPR